MNSKRTLSDDESETEGDKHVDVKNKRKTTLSSHFSSNKRIKNESTAHERNESPKTLNIGEKLLVLKFSC
jgi:hypothetical protein